MSTPEGFDDLVAMVSTLEGQVESLEASNTAIAGEIAVLKGADEDLRASIARLDTKDAELMTMTTTNANDIAQIKTDLAV
jgi:hypothetical protein